MVLLVAFDVQPAGIHGDKSIRCAERQVDPLRGFHRYGPLLRVNEFVVLRLRSDSGIRLTPGQVSRAVPPTPNIPWYTLAVQPARRARGG